MSIVQVTFCLVAATGTQDLFAYGDKGGHRRPDRRGRGHRNRRRRGGNSGSTIARSPSERSKRAMTTLTRVPGESRAPSIDRLGYRTLPGTLNERGDEQPQVSMRSRLPRRGRRTGDSAGCQPAARRPYPRPRERTREVRYSCGLQTSEIRALEPSSTGSQGTRASAGRRKRRLLNEDRPAGQIGSAPPPVGIAVPLPAT